MLTITSIQTVFLFICIVQNLVLGWHARSYLPFISGQTTSWNSRRW